MFNYILVGGFNAVNLLFHPIIGSVMLAHQNLFYCVLLCTYVAEIVCWVLVLCFIFRSLGSKDLGDVTTQILVIVVKFKRHREDPGSDPLTHFCLLAFLGI